MPITSNLILKTSLPKPTGSGYGDVITKLRTIDRLLDNIISKSSATITITFKVIGKAPNIPKGGNRGGGGGGKGKGGGVEPEGNLPRPRGRKFPINPLPQKPALDLVDQIGSTTTTKTSFDKKGRKKNEITALNKFKSVQEDIEYSAKQTVSAKGNQTKLEEDQVNFAKQKEISDKKALYHQKKALDDNRKLFNERVKQLKQMGFIEDKNFADNEAAKKLVAGLPESEEKIRRKKFVKPDRLDPTILRTYEITDEIGKKQIQAGQKKNQAELKARADADRAAKKSQADAAKAQKAADAALAKSQKAAAVAAAKAQKAADAAAAKAQRDADKAQKDADRAAAKAQRDADKAAKLAAKPVQDLAKAQDIFDRRKERAEITNQKLIAKGYKLQEEKLSDIEILKGSGVYGKVTKSTFVRPDAADSTKLDVVKTSTQTGSKTLRSKDNTAVIKEQKARAEHARRALDIEQQANTLLGQGFSRTADKLIRDSKGMTHAVQQFAKVSGNALHGYTVELARINTLTGKTEAEILTGAKAWKFLGDSVARSTVKVALWTAATTAVFGTIAAIRTATQAITELEAGTVLLARVGAGLGNSFNERLKQAAQLTDEIVKLSVATSTSAVEGQKAAAIFLRTGQSRAEAVKSVTAALIASRIAELGVVEAAQLLTAAQTQFNLSADQLIPTLDTLNELSNKYRVTTNDLLQAISRTGSVFEQQGGTLSQLAAIIAVTAQTTARSGAEIGNAIKTVESRLASADVADTLLRKTGIGFRNAAGEARALSDILLELQVAFLSLSKAEQDAVTIAGAGVRQRNILIAQVNGAVDIIIAESRALRGDADEYSEYGSAISEAAQTSATLEAQLKRLQSSFIKLAQSGKGPFIDLLKTAVFALQKVLDLLNMFNGAPLKLLAFAAAVGTVNLVMHKLGSNTSSLGNLTAKAFDAMSGAAERYRRSLAASSLAQTRQQYGGAGGFKGTYQTRRADALLRARGDNTPSLGDKFKGIAAAVVPATAGIKAFGLALVSSIGPQVLFTAGLTLAMQLFSHFADRSARAAALLELQAAGHDAAAAHANKQRLAIEGLANAIGKQIQAYNQLGAAEKKVVGQNISKLIKELELNGVNIPVNFNPGDPKKVAELQANVAKKAAEKAATEQDRIGKQIQAKTLAREKKKNELIARQQNLRLATTESGTLASTGARVDEFLGGNVLLLGLDEELKNIQTQLKAYEGGVGEAGSATDEFATELRELQKKYKEASEASENAKFGASTALEVRIAINELDALDKKLTDIDKNSSQLKDISASLGLDEQSGLAREIADTTNVLDDFKQKLDFVLSQPISTENSQLIDEYGKSMEKAAIKVRGLTAEKERMNAVSIQKSLKEMSDFDSKIDIARTALDVTKGRIGLDPEQYSQKNNDVFQQINERNRLIAQAGQLTGTANASKDPNVIAASKSEAQDRLNQAAQKELEIQTSIYEKERAIVEEKKKANDELQKSLGLLSEEDKARLLVQADYFNKNPNAKLSIEQQFAGSSESNKIAQDYFANRLETSDQARARGSALQTGPFGNLVNKEMQDLSVQQDELDRMRRGGGLDSASARDRFLGNKNAANRIAGQPEVSNMDMTTPGTDTSVYVNMSGLDLEPLVSKFEEVTIGRMNTMAADMIARLEAIERKYTVPKSKPGVAAAAGGN